MTCWSSAVPPRRLTPTPSGATAEAVSDGRFVGERDGCQVREISYVILAGRAAQLCCRYRSKGPGVMASRSGRATAAARVSERSGCTAADAAAAAAARIGDGAESLAHGLPELGRTDLATPTSSTTAWPVCGAPRHPSWNWCPRSTVSAGSGHSRCRGTAGSRRHGSPCPASAATRCTGTLPHRQWRVGARSRPHVSGHHGCPGLLRGGEGDVARTGPCAGDPRPVRHRRPASSRSMGYWPGHGSWRAGGGPLRL